MEPNKVIEIDRVRNESLLTSVPARSCAMDRSSTIELVLHGTSGALMRRYQAWPEPGQKRIQVPFALTNEALGEAGGRRRFGEVSQV